MDNVFETILLILYLVVLAAQIVLFVRCIRQHSLKRWLILFTFEEVSFIIAFLLMHYFDNLPGYGMMPGLTYFAATMYSLGAAILYCIMLLLSVVTAIALQIRKESP